jgi:hypothetical protein
MADIRADELTRTIKAGDFETAQRLATEHGDSALAGGNAIVLRQALDTLNDSLHLTRVLRAHLAEQVRANCPAIEYQSAAAENPRWQFEG